MNRRPLQLALAAAATLAAASHADAASGTYQLVNAYGRYYTDEGVEINSTIGSGFTLPDGSDFRYVTCVGSDPGVPACSVPGGPPPPPGTWYELPALPSAAAAQARTPDFGVMQARTWARGTHGAGTGDPGFTVYTASANSGFVDEITTTSAVPVVIHFVFSLHGQWNDGGVLALQAGRPGTYNPDVPGGTPMDGHTWTNCATCGFGYDTGIGRSLLPGGDNGAVDMLVSVPFIVDPNPEANPFEAVLLAHSFLDGAEVEAYSTVTLQAILAPAGAGLAFASGHTYNVQLVPEPATWALWAGGLAGLAGWARRGRRSPAH